MIYTSYFAKLRNIPSDIFPVSIAGKPPISYANAQYKHLAPKYEFFMEWKKNHDNDYYIKHYKAEVLNTLSAKYVVDWLYKLSGGKDVVLLCYEKPGDFCHRHLVAEWLKENGFDCNEYSFDTVNQKEENL